jgi:hypothetical protein
MLSAAVKIFFHGGSPRFRGYKSPHNSVILSFGFFLIEKNTCESLKDFKLLQALDFIARFHRDGE